MKKIFCSVREAADALSIGRSKAYELINQGAIKTGRSLPHATQRLAAKAGSPHGICVGAGEWLHDWLSRAHPFAPARPRFARSSLRRWAEAISGQQYRTDTIRTKRISEAAYDINLGVLVGYLCKGAFTEVADALRLERRKPGGIILGKRAGWSENVGEKARHRWVAEQRRGAHVVQDGRASI